MITYLKDRQSNGDKLILWTCRIDEMLDNAVRWCRNKGLIFDAVNENLPSVIAEFGTDTRKIFANEYIDDRNVWLPSEKRRTFFISVTENNVEIPAHLRNVNIHRIFLTLRIFVKAITILTGKRKEGPR